jgi:hypothetical protein
MYVCRGALSKILVEIGDGVVPVVVYQHLAFVDSDWAATRAHLFNGSEFGHGLTGAGYGDSLTGVDALEKLRKVCFCLVDVYGDHGPMMD